MIHPWIFVVTLISALQLFSALSPDSTITDPDREEGPATTHLHQIYGVGNVTASLEHWQKGWQSRSFTPAFQQNIIGMADWYGTHCLLQDSYGGLRHRILNDLLTFADALTYHAYTEGLPIWLATTIQKELPHAPTQLQIFYIDSLYAPLYRTHQGNLDQLDFVIKWSGRFAKGAHPETEYGLIASLVCFLSQKALENSHRLHGLEGQLDTQAHRFAVYIGSHPDLLSHTQALAFLSSGLWPTEKKVRFPETPSRPINLGRYPSASSAESGDTVILEDSDV